MKYYNFFTNKEKKGGGKLINDIVEIENNDMRVIK